MGVITRGTKLWLRFKDATGAWQTIRSGLVVGQETEAAELLAEAESEAARARGEVRPEIVRAETVRAFAGPWIDKRREKDLDWKNDASRLEHHVFPKIGDMKLRDVRTKHLIELFHWRRTTPLEATGEMPSQRLIYNIYSVVSALFRDAKKADLITQTPCELDENDLGPLKDKNPEWRNGAVFTRDEAVTLISHPEIDADRHVVYALELLAGVRPGEAAALRWRHWERDLKPLGKLLVALSYNTRKNRAKGTKTDVVKHVPVHPTLAAMLAEWRLSGWEAMYGRAPGPDDLIVPLPPGAAARRRTRTGDPFRGTDYSYKRWAEEDLPMLGWRDRQHYNMRATFISLALEDGADENIIESRVTHTKKSRGAFGGYVRGERWARTCAEVAKLQITRKHGDDLALPVAIGGSRETPPARHTVVTATATSDDDNENGWRRRESKHAPPTFQNTACTESPRLMLVGGPHTVTIPADHCDESLQQDPVSTALDAARAAWAADGDARALRRALAKLLGEID